MLTLHNFSPHKTLNVLKILHKKFSSQITVINVQITKHWILYTFLQCFATLQDIKDENIDISWKISMQTSCSLPKKVKNKVVCLLLGLKIQMPILRLQPRKPCAPVLSSQSIPQKLACRWRTHIIWNSNVHLFSDAMAELKKTWTKLLTF